jgi:hypothetical protein
MPATENERKSAFFSSIKKKFTRCLEPNWSCESPSISSHSVQNATALSQIEEGGHVMEMRMNFSAQPPQPELRSIGRNDASTFPGFCQKHDSEIFKPIDTKPLDVKDGEQLFLLAYRSVSRELHAIMDGAVRVQGGLEFLVKSGEVEADKPSGPMVEATVHLLKSWGMYKYRSKFYDSAILHRRYDGIKHSVFAIEDEKPVLAASSFFSVKPPKRPGHLFPGVSLNVVPQTASKATVVFSYASEHSGDVRKYIAPIILATGDARKHRLSEMIVYRTENFFIAPSKVASWSEDKRRAIEATFTETMLKDADPVENEHLMLF